MQIDMERSIAEYLGKRSVLSIELLGDFDSGKILQILNMENR